jgi:hypothetical protein
MELLVGAGQRHKYRNLRKLCDFASRFQTLTLTPIWTWQCDMALVAGGKSEGREETISKERYSKINMLTMIELPSSPPIDPTICSRTQAYTR